MKDHYIILVFSAALQVARAIYWGLIPMLSLCLKIKKNNYMKMMPAQFNHDPEFSILLSYSDLDKVAEIDHYYQNLLSLLNLSERLDAREKLGQHVFLSREWEKELTPLLNLISINIYGSR